MKTHSTLPCPIATDDDLIWLVQPRFDSALQFDGSSRLCLQLSLDALVGIWLFRVGRDQHDNLRSGHVDCGFSATFDQIADDRDDCFFGSEPIVFDDLPELGQRDGVPSP